MILSKTHSRLRKSYHIHINEPQSQVADKGKEKAVDPPPFEPRGSTRDRKEGYPKDSIYGKQTPLETEKGIKFGFPKINLGSLGSSKKHLKNQLKDGDMAQT